MNWKLIIGIVLLMTVVTGLVALTIADDRNFAQNSIHMYEGYVDNLSTLLNGGSISSEDYQNLWWISHSEALRNRDEFSEALRRKGRTWDDLNVVFAKQVFVK